ncbi:hypothetical protein Cgig2_016748 [Carnegiea gigantea]|uniref:3'-5' exonuclease domain-containing protein n=1 Tax=Carnegiea gigantea TaxID=171969 RepID=A0A9Q1KYP2_9CARY|nr:hypothetical protein Cgig2_016748 [Carnegiea gigantea]
MEHKLRLRLAFVVACATAILCIAVHRRRRRNARKTSCYLEFETKPQSSFKQVLADNSYSPFKHLKLANSVDAKLSNLHPYEADIMALVKSPEVDYRIFNEIVLTTMSESYVWVETEPQLQELANVLSKEKIFAVDTEQHSFRSFLGFTALIQVSTQKEDYLIDTIALHDAMDIIRPVFSDPTVLKVFHGADNDVLWLQRDFHLYVVNLFDTAKACEVLSKPHKSLAYLLETCCGVITNKSFQREDWRQRPLPEEMLEYARSDAHYLLYIARCLLDELRHRGNGILSTSFLFSSSICFGSLAFWLCIDYF